MYKLRCRVKSKPVEGAISNRIAEILINIDTQHIPEAEKWINKSIETNEQYGMMWNLAQDYALYAQLYKKKGDPTKYREALNKAVEIFEECGADGWVERYEKELGLLL